MARAMVKGDLLGFENTDTRFDLSRVKAKRLELENHPLLVNDIIKTQDDLRIFMQCHVYAVWDFMSLAKGLQNFYTPYTVTWRPTSANRSNYARMINEILLSEETDIGPDGENTMNHFDLYVAAMKEVGAETDHINRWIDDLTNLKFDRKYVPEPAQKFMATTFKAINTGAHTLAASFCYGRETAIPAMFTRILSQTKTSRIDAPMFYYYLERHIALDGDDHGPKAAEIVYDVCDRIGGTDLIYQQAEQAALDAIQARIDFFDGIQQLIQSK